MEKLAPLVVAGPFLIAALFAISMPLSRRRDDIVSIVTASAGVVFVGALLIDVLSPQQLTAIADGLGKGNRRMQD